MSAETARRSEMPVDPAELADRVWLAGLGAVATARTEGSRLLDALVEKGEELEREGFSARSIAHPLCGAWNSASHGAASLVAELRTTVDRQTTRLLQRLGLPTRDEIAALTRRIEELTASIESLRARR